MNAHPLSWLKQIQSELNLAQKIPLWGSPPPFPWEELSDAISASLQIQGLSIHPEGQKLCSAEELTLSFGKKPVIKALELSPLPGFIYLSLARESLEKLTTIALSSQEEAKGFNDPQLQEGFFEYLLLCASDSFSKISPYADLQLQLLDAKPLPHSAAFCVDLSIKVPGHTFLARLVFSPAFHGAFADRFAQDLPDLFTSPLLENVQTHIALETGSCLLEKKDFDRLHVGDLLVLDRCSYDPVSHKGTLTLSLNKTPLFKVKIKKEGLKILDYCTSYGDTHTMDDDQDLDSFLPDEEGSSDFSDSAPSNAEKLSSSLEIPFPIVVEIGRTSMPLKKLLSLEPGNVLDLGVTPEDGVYLSVHGKKIAKGELVKLGDAIGVKIVEIGERSSV